MDYLEVMDGKAVLVKGNKPPASGVWEAGKGNKGKEDELRAALVAEMERAREY